MGNHKGVSAEGSVPWDAHVAGVCHTQGVGGPRAREGEVVPLLAAVEPLRRVIEDRASQAISSPS